MNELKTKVLIKLIKDGEITTKDIKSPDYKAEVESRLQH